MLTTDICVENQTKNLETQAKKEGRGGGGCYQRLDHKILLGIFELI